MFLRSRACRSFGPMPLETLARLAAALLFSALRPLMAIRAGIIQKGSDSFADARRCSLTLYIFS
jgi:hypothetical protein